MADIICNVCGGTSFHKESGFYYCNECQTQSQDIQERVFAIDEDNVTQQPTAKVRSSKRIRSAKKSEERLTSWECYNYILRGLVEELIQLGASVALKKTVRILWFRYLQKLEVTNSPNEFPKIGAVNSKIDAEIIYGRPAKRKRIAAKRTSSPSSSSEGVTDSSLSRRELSKKRRSLVLAEYDEFSATLQSEETSLQNQSLTSLKSSEDSSKDKEKFLQYNKYAKKELLKQISRSHLRQHIEDINSTRTCHQVSYKSFSATYVEGPAVLSRAKIYALLYLGLLINKDNIQLGDVLRFIREGNLSYHHVNHFFPEELHQKLSSIRTWNEKQAFLTHGRMRRFTAQLAHFLNVTHYVPMQNLIHLCRRYCSELNLPEEIWAFSINLMARTFPKMKFTKKSILIPNYEGRVLSIIAFILKLILGLDDKTEMHFSNFAKEVNEVSTNTDQEEMFNWNEWIYHIRYRKLLLTQHHFPTKDLFSECNSGNVDLSVNYLSSDYAKVESDLKLSRELQVIKTLLAKFRDQQDELPQKLTFPATLTPFRTYLETLLNSQVVKGEQGYLTDVLEWNFQHCSFKFLITPFQFLDEVHKDCKISLKHRGANNRVKIIKFKNLKVQRNLWRKYAKKEVFVNISSKSSSNKKVLKEHFSHLEDTITERNSKDILKNFTERNTPSFSKHKKSLIKSFKKDRNVFNASESTLSATSMSDNSQRQAVDNNLRLHYIPYERYWLKNLNVNYITDHEFLKFFQTFPKSFQDLMTECARVTEQKIKELYEEFTDVEVYLSYVAKFTVLDKNRSKVANPELKSLITKATKSW